ncbi:MAG: cation:proton antiporter [Candidatus Infernicultor aquiphilus]|uniref:Cation:proton antiporter n=2 Tax=Candidatus Infernicultor aquiphilus TaxID=1805029 RepID=A0A2M7PLN0_9BACT|nr:Na+/H+ antiporter subunit E [bacterium]PIX34623.1 MAG: cation:proton antiporter [Candidatus Atribacteria bacterium CG_4_8_14_3_um_filter_34_18]PIY31207.1 MAG: cation:proton antiporter [Candidatus Atribacteria bacterium CG_4_10_14_3_um_filter_34_13]
MFFVAFIVWCLLDWVPDWQHLIVGGFVSAFVTFMIGDLFITRPHVLKHPLRYWYFFAYYLPIFLWECFKANLDVAYRVLHPRLPINPGIVKVKVELKTDTALTFLANSITLTPGTMSVDIDKDNGILYIHWIDVKTKDIESTTRIIVERFEKILKKIFD